MNEVLAEVLASLRQDNPEPRHRMDHRRNAAGILATKPC